MNLLPIRVYSLPPQNECLDKVFFAQSFMSFLALIKMSYCYDYIRLE